MGGWVADCCRVLGGVPRRVAAALLHMFVRAQPKKTSDGARAPIGDPSTWLVVEAQNTPGNKPEGGRGIDPLLCLLLASDQSLPRSKDCCTL